MLSDNLVTAHAHNVIILYGATVNINPVSAPATNNVARIRSKSIQKRVLVVKVVLSLQRN